MVNTVGCSNDDSKNKNEISSTESKLNNDTSKNKVDLSGVVYDKVEWDLQQYDSISELIQFKTVELNLISTYIFSNAQTFEMYGCVQEITSTEAYQNSAKMLLEFTYGAQNFDATPFAETYSFLPNIVSRLSDTADTMLYWLENFPNWLIDEDYDKIIDELNPISEELTKITNELLEHFKPTLNVNDEISYDEIGTLTYIGHTFSDEVFSESTRSSKSYKVYDSENTFLVVEFTLKNQLSDRLIVGVDEVLNIIATFQQKYNYDALEVAEGDGGIGLGSHFYLAPLNTSRIVGIIEIPKILVDEPCEVTTTFLGVDYKIEING